MHFLIKIALLSFVLLNPFFLNLLSKEQEKNTEKTYKHFKSEIHLCDGRVLSGTIQINPPEKIIIIHEVNGLEFTKELSIEDIQSILLIGWNPELIEVKKDKGKIYKFIVSYYIIQTPDLELKIKKPLPEFLEKFTFKNKLGMIILYTYWIDLLKQDNSWFTGLNGPEQGERNFCYKDVVKKIIFKKQKNQEN